MIDFKGSKVQICNNTNFLKVLNHFLDYHQQDVGCRKFWQRFSVLYSFFDLISHSILAHRSKLPLPNYLNVAAIL